MIFCIYFDYHHIFVFSFVSYMIDWSLYNSLLFSKSSSLAIKQFIHSFMVQFPIYFSYINLLSLNLEVLLLISLWHFIWHINKKAFVFEFVAFNLLIHNYIISIFSCYKAIFNTSKKLTKVGTMISNLPSLYKSVITGLANMLALSSLYHFR